MENEFGENIILRLQQRSLRGTHIKQLTVICEKCHRYLGFRDFHLRICDHIFFGREGYRNAMWDVLCDEPSSGYDLATDMYRNSRYYIIC